MELSASYNSGDLGLFNILTVREVHTRKYLFQPSRYIGRDIGLGRLNKYFSYETSSRLITALLYTHLINQYMMKKMLFNYCVRALRFMRRPVRLCTDWLSADQLA